MQNEPQDAEVIVIGAGMAGLTAARALAERGISVLILEAREHVGGRVLSKQVDGAMVELGAEFVHGRPPELWALIEEVGIETIGRDGAMLRAQSGGGVVEDDPQDDSMLSPLEQLEDYDGDDIPFAEWLKTSGVPEWQRGALLGYVEGFNAADAGCIGIHALAAQQKAEDAIDGDRAWHVHGGYALLAEYLARRVRELGGTIVLGAVVRQIEWQPGSVHVVTESGAEFRAEKCIVTVPLGVLQRANRGGVEIIPEPPAVEAARRLAMGDAVRFTMVFRRAWWVDAPVALSTETLRSMSFLFTQETVPAVWWTPHPEPGPAMLTAWIGGPRSAKLMGQTAEQLGEAACCTLARVFGLAEEDVRRELVSTHTHDWAGDPFSLGAYSYVPAGALDAPRAMTESAFGTLFFAGEHTDVTGHWGTVHAAIRSGLRAAEQVFGEIS